MKLEHVTFSGPAIDDHDLLDQLPKTLANLLQQNNGFIQYHGGLHVRGACKAPAWHSLRAAWLGDDAFHRHYPELTADDIPFGEDFLGDQFFLRDATVWKLFGETGEIESLEVNFSQFMKEVQDDPGEELGLHPLLQFQREGGKLEPGQLLSAYPPYCLEESEDGVTFSAVPAAERHSFLASFAAQIRDVPDGGKIDIKFED